MQPKKHRKLRILPIVLSMAMMLTMIPVTASASVSVNALNESVDPIKNANLSSLSISPGTLSPTFDAGVTIYCDGGRGCHRSSYNMRHDGKPCLSHNKLYGV